MELLEPCVCGAKFEHVAVEQEHYKTKWATAICPVCGEWSIEFRSFYKDGEELQKLADQAWNNAPRVTNNV